MLTDIVALGILGLTIGLLWLMARGARTTTPVWEREQAKHYRYDQARLQKRWRALWLWVMYG